MKLKRSILSLHVIGIGLWACRSILRFYVASENFHMTHVAARTAQRYFISNEFFQKKAFIQEMETAIAATSSNTKFQFDQMEAILRESVDLVIERHFEQSSRLYNKFFTANHPWLEPDGLAARMRIIRGEDQLPHLPNSCTDCREIFREQLAVLKEHDMYASCGPGKRHKRNPGRVKIGRRVRRVRERLQALAQRSGALAV